MSAYLYLVGSLLSLAVAATTWFLARRLGALSSLYFFVGWTAGELALQLTAMGAVVTLAFAGAGALSEPAGVWGLAFSFLAWGLLLAGHRRALGSRDEVLAFGRAANLVLEDDVRPSHGFWLPFRMRRPGVRRIRNLAYGEPLPGDKGARNLLDIVLPDSPGSDRPTLVQIHGGAWVMGDKREQGGPLMAHLAARGWVCFAINYRLSPQATFPDHIVDVKRAIDWVRRHAGEYGGDPNFLCVTGGSAGGHLTALAALSQNDPDFQPGFESADTRVSAAVPFYGVYDFCDRSGIRGTQNLETFLSKQVLKCSPKENPDLWEAASPIARVSSDAPPMFMIQGTHDSLVFVEEAREFVRALRAESKAPVEYLEMLGAQHAFDCFHSVRSANAVRAVTAFLEREHERYRERSPLT
ncbi:alpha/beta hydrolase [Myxococcota bacterium]|nr:alpha/beta hydrolase [Myxococcota bacterium]